MQKNKPITQSANFSTGQSLFEVVVALAISALIIGAIVSLTTNSIRNSTFSKNQSLAATYAQQATEWLRGQRDADITIFEAKASLPEAIDPKTNLVTWCFKDLSWSQPNVCSDTDTILGTPFIRQVTFNIDNSSPKTLIAVDIKVSWSDSQGTHNITSATSFTDWRQR